MYTGPSWQKQFKSMTFSIGLSLEMRSLSKVTLTREAGCKFFAENDVPPQICSPSRDLRLFKSMIGFGARLDLAVDFTLASDLALVFNPSLSHSLYTTDLTSFKFPLGGAVKLKYRF